MEATENRRNDGGGEVTGVVLRMRTVIEAMLGVLGEGGIAFEGEAGGVEGKRVVSSNVMGSAEVRFGGLELWNDVSSGS